MIWTLALGGVELARGTSDPTPSRGIVRLVAYAIVSAPEVGTVGVLSLGPLRAKAFVRYVSRRGGACRGFQLALRGDAVRVVDVVLAWDRPGRAPAAIYYDGAEPVPEADRALVEARLALLAMPKLQDVRRSRAYAPVALLPRSGRYLFCQPSVQREHGWPGLHEQCDRAASASVPTAREALTPSDAAAASSASDSMGVRRSVRFTVWRSASGMFAPLLRLAAIRR